MDIKGPEADLGVIIARFQTPFLTPGHRDLIETVRAKHKKFAIILGIAPVCPSTKNPLDFTTRLKMLLNEYPGIEVLGMFDNRSDKIWSSKVDNLLRTIHPHERIVLYGARDSFIEHYLGKLKVVELQSDISISGTEARNGAFHDVRDSEDFRAGVCYATANQYRKNVLCVDVAIVNHGKQQLLLGQKQEDGGLWRFFGGHVDANETAEAAVRREASEETGASVDGLMYLGSTPIDDWRYAGVKDGIFTIFYAAIYQFGRIEGADDIDGAVKWFNFSELKEEMFVPEHRILFRFFRDGYMPI